MTVPSPSADQTPRPDVATLLAMLSAAPGPRTHETDPPTARQMLAMLTQLADEPPGDRVTIRDLSCPSAIAGGSLPCRLFDRSAAGARGPGPMVLFFHGGGFVIGDSDIYAGFCAAMADALDLPVLSVDYRLAPEHPYPTAPDDCLAAARWVADGPAELGLEVTGLVLAGDSAGGNLAIVTGQALAASPAAVPVVAQFAIYPLTDASKLYPSFHSYAEEHFLDVATMRWFTDHYAADDPFDVRVSPLLSDRLADTPPTVVLTAGLDPLRDQGRAYAAALAAAGVEVHYLEGTGLIHGFIFMRRAIPSAKTDLDRAFAAVRSLAVRA